jgi:hypothetical protein
MADGKCSVLISSFPEMGKTPIQAALFVRIFTLFTS